MFGNRNDKEQSKANPISFASTTSSNNIDTLISDACEIQGNINSDKSIKIDGKVIGDVTVKGTVVISTSGCVTGDINADALIVYGTLDGDSTTQDIHLQESGHVEGNIKTQSLQVEPNATYNGVVTMSAQSTNSKPVLNYDQKKNAATDDVAS